MKYRVFYRQTTLEYVDVDARDEQEAVMLADRESTPTPLEEADSSTIYVATLH